MSKPPLTGQVILITGAGSGIGAATALELHGRGAIPVLVDCDADTLAHTAATLGPDTLSVRADVSSLADCEAAVAQTLARHGRIDVVWANAGVAAFGPLAFTDPAAWKRCVEVNVFGVFNTVRAALPAVMRQRGYVLASASVSSFAHPPAVSAYAASKAAVEAMCNAWRIELAAHGVRVGALHASWVSTALVTEGALHPGFVRLRQAAPAALNRETSAQDAARLIADGMARRARQIWVPGWVRLLHWLRALLHTKAAERELLRAAPEIERYYLEGLAAEGALASSFGPRERARSLARLAATATPLTGAIMELGAFSISLSVKDIAVSRAFYETLGFTVFGGNQEQRWLIMKSGTTLIGLFQGMFEGNMLTFNPGWDSNAQPVPGFADIREIQRRLKSQGVALTSEADVTTTGPANFVVVDPDGNQILVDQHL